jgi:flavodoxin
MPKTLVVFYSLTGFTKTAAEELARVGGWEIGEIRDVLPRRGIWSRLRCLIEARIGLNPRIDYRGPDPAEYDFVLLGAPVWGYHIASPLLGFFAQHRSRLKHIAFFFTFGGGGADSVARQAGKLVGGTDFRTLFLKDNEMKSGSFRDRVSDFVRVLRTLGA